MSGMAKRMWKNTPRGAIRCAVTVAVLVAVHAISGRFVAARDPIAAVLGGGVEVVLAAVAMMLSRMFLFLLAPAWALYVVGRAVLERRLRARRG